MRKHATQSRKKCCWWQSIGNKCLSAIVQSAPSRGRCEVRHDECWHQLLNFRLPTPNGIKLHSQMAPIEAATYKSCIYEMTRVRAFQIQLQRWRNLSKRRRLRFALSWSHSSNDYFLTWCRGVILISVYLRDRHMWWPRGPHLTHKGTASNFQRNMFLFGYSDDWWEESLSTGHQFDGIDKQKSDRFIACLQWCPSKNILT